MNPSTMNITSEPYGGEQAGEATQGLKYRLAAFRRTHSYKEIQVAGIVAILDAEGIERVDVIGSSFGGYIAQCFVRACSERVDRLILAETGVRHFVSWAPPIYLLAGLMSILPPRAVRFMMWHLWTTLFTPPASQRDFWRELMRETLTTQLTKANFVSEPRLIADFSAHYHFGSGDLAAWPGEILILESERDEAYSPANRARTRAAYPQARVHVIRCATHSAIATHTEEYVRTMREFLARAQLPAEYAWLFAPDREKARQAAFGGGGDEQLSPPAPTRAVEG